MTTWARDLVCSRTGATQELDQPAFLSEAGAPLLVRYELNPGRGKSLLAELEGRPWTLWRYRELLPMRDPDGRIDLGEGGTPLIPLRRTETRGVQVWIKEEGGNPTGSFKARGLSLAVNRARELGAAGVQLPSAGNAALSLCAYASAAGLPARVAIPEDTPPRIAQQCRLHGAEVLTAKGTLVDAAARLREHDDGYWDLSTLKEPYRAEGKKTMGLEIAEQFRWQLPDWIVYPTGGGTGIVGMHKAFAELEELGLIGPERPKFLSVQMAGCAPIVKAWEEGQEKAVPWPSPQTQAWGLRVPQAIGDFLILRALRETGGRAIAIAEERLSVVASRYAAQEGLLIGPEGAAALAGCEDLIAAGAMSAGQRVIVFQTGHPGNYL